VFSLKKRKKGFLDTDLVNQYEFLNLPLVKDFDCNLSLSTFPWSAKPLSISFGFNSNEFEIF
jgi:hypothetical protein